MNIAFLSHSRNYYGANRSLLGLIHGLLRLRLKTGVIVPEECRLTRELRAVGIPVAVIPQARWFHASDRVYKDGGASDRKRFVCLREECQNRVVVQLQKWGAEVVYSNSVMIDIGARSAQVLGVPHVWHLREFGDLDYGMTPVLGWEEVRTAVARSHVTISVSDAIRRHFIPSAVADKDTVVYSGVAFDDDIQRLRLLRRAAIRSTASRRRFTFALLGRFFDGKGQRTAIAALARLKSSNVNLILAGGGNAEPLRRAVKELGVTDLVEFRGYVDDPLAVFLQADAALMCSRHEAFGRVTAEAMATGLPVIGRDSGGTSEIIEDLHNGILYSGGPEQLAASMERLATAVQWTRQLGDSAWLTAREKFSIENCTMRVRRALDAALCGTIGTTPSRI